MKVERIDNDNLETTLKVTIEPSDYLAKFNEEFKKVKGKVSIKGFRQGKTPDRVVKRLYGNPILIDVMEKAFQESLNSYIDEHKIEYVCQPLPTDGQEVINPNINDTAKTYTFSYDLGILPEFDIKGISGEDSYDFYVAKADADALTKQMDAYALSLGSIEPVKDEIQESDMLALSAVEVSEKGTKVKNGWETSFDINIDQIIDEDLKKSIIGNKKGHSFKANISELTSADAAKARKDFLQVEEEDEREIKDSFKFKVEEVSRRIPKELTDEVIKENLGQNGLETVDQLKERINANLTADLKGISDSVFYTDLMERIREETTFAIPDGFVKRWLKQAEKIEDDKVEEMYESFVKDLEWSVIRRKLEEKYNVQVTRDDMGQYFHSKAEQFMNQMGFYDESIFKTVVERMSSDQNEVYKASNAISTNKIFKQIEGEIVKVEQEIPEEELRNKLSNTQNPPALSEEEE